MKTHGREFTGRVVKDRMQKTVTVERDRRKYLPKYERYAKQNTTIKAHNPDDKASEGDIVKIKETKPISKTKHFIVTEIVEEAE
ncbi:MAG: 30S ribosomal protein S17 [Halobacteriaceae archaeon]